MCENLPWTNVLPFTSVLWSQDETYYIIGNLKFGSLLSYEGLLFKPGSHCLSPWMSGSTQGSSDDPPRPMLFTATRQSELMNIQAASDRLWSVNFVTCFTKTIRIQPRPNIKDWTLRYWWRALSVFLCFQLLICDFHCHNCSRILSNITTGQKTGHMNFALLILCSFQVTQQKAIFHSKASGF